jgi:4-amino-4-deoxy-L-arabinose transferase-like glycosyltransferase
MVVFHQILLLHRDVDVDHFLGPTDGFECFGKDGAGNGRAIWQHYETLSYMSRYITIDSSMNFDSTRYFLFLFLVALIARISMVEFFQFDGLYGQDPYAYFNYSLELRQALGQLKPPPPFFWPIGYPLLVVLATLFAGVRPLAGQLVSMIAGALIAPLIFLMVCEVKPGAKAGAMVAGLLAAVSGQLMLSSTSVMSDAAGLAWVTLSAGAMLRYTQALRPGWLVLSAFTLGWAVLTRWALALAALPLALSAFLAWRTASWRWRGMAAAAALAVLAGGLVLGSQFVSSLGQGELAHVGDLQVVGWNPANALKSTVANSDGIFHYERPIGLFYATPATHPAFVFPLLTPFLMLGLWSLRDRFRPHAALLIGWPLTFYIFLAGIAWENPRFSLAFFPPLAALVGLGFQLAWDWKRVPTWLLHLWRPFLAGWCALALAGSLAWSVRDLQDFTSINQAHITAAQWVAEQVPAGAKVITFDITQTMGHRTELDVEEIYHLDEKDLSKLITTEIPTYLFLNLNNVESQWQGKSPQLNYQWLQENKSMREIGRYPPFTLYHIP